MASVEDLMKQATLTIEKVEGWKDDIRSVVADYEKAITTVQSAIDRIEKSEKKWWRRHAPAINLAIIVLIVFGSVYWIANSENFCGTIEFPFGASYEGKDCK